VRFLGEVAERAGAVVATAHSRDDQIETVLMRVMREAGARGLAGLFASSETLRPLIECSRDEVADYARSVGAAWIEDPTNASMRFLRNRVRRDLLPALRVVNRKLGDELIGLARCAASWRRRLDAVARSISRVERGAASIPTDAVGECSLAELSVVWPAVAARVGLAMDWRGTERAAAFTKESRVGGRIPLSGGWEISRSRDRFELRKVETPAGFTGPRLLRPGIEWDGWHFAATPRRGAVSDEWVALLPNDVALTVRQWEPGDRMRAGTGGARKVKRFLSDARVSGARRGQWPVVLAGDEIVWIPGVRRSDAAAVRPGRPGVLYRCELNDR
jgi:tRNA(Ile)-lysidine synthase